MTWWTANAAQEHLAARGIWRFSMIEVTQPGLYKMDFPVAEAGDGAVPTQPRITFNAALEAAPACDRQANGHRHQSRGKPRWRPRR